MIKKIHKYTFEMLSPLTLNSIANNCSIPSPYDCETSINGINSYEVKLKLKKKNLLVNTLPVFTLERNEF